MAVCFSFIIIAWAEIAIMKVCILLVYENQYGVVVGLICFVISAIVLFGK